MHPRARVTWRAVIGHKDQQDLVSATTSDVSVGGVSLRAPLPAAPGDELLLLVWLNDLIVPALATVVRAEIVEPDEAVLHMKFSWFSGFGEKELGRLIGAPDQAPFLIVR
jgi:hypothetical protein